MKKLAIVFIMLFVSSFAWGVVCPTGYTTTVTVLVKPQSMLSADVSNFQMTYLGHPSLASVANGGNVNNSDTNGLGVVWCDAPTSGNVIPYELVAGTYNASTGAGEWHISTTVSKTQTGKIYGMVGTASPTDKSCGPSGTNNCGTTLWNNFKLAAHFGTSGTLTLTDSSANNTLVNHSMTATAAKINGGANDTGTSYIDVGAANNLTTVTYGGWVNVSSFSTNQRVMSNLTGSAFNGYEMIIGTGAANGTVLCQVGSAGSLGSNSGSQPTVSTGQWNLIYCIARPSAVPQPYVNAVGGTYTGVSSSVGTSSVNLNLGRWSGGASNSFNGSQDEMRVYNGQLSTDYMLAQVYNQNFAQFYTTVYRSAQHFYVSSAGSDSNNGTTTGTPWQTISKVNSYASSQGFVPDDEISFRVGDSFTGPITTSGLYGDPTGYITVDTYNGAGTATITSGSGVTDGFTCTNCEFVGVNGLTFTGSGWTGSGTSVTVSNGGTGINFVSSNLTRLRNNFVLNNTVSGYQWGVTFDARASATYGGFTGPVIYNNTVSNNLTGGIFLQGYGAYTSSATTTQINNVYIGHNLGKGIPGDPNSGTGGVHGAYITDAWCINGANGTGWTIERNTCLDIAGYGGAISGIGAGGSAAINLADARNYTMNHNEVARTKCASAFDGAALDLDTNTQTGEVAHNLTYENSGPSVQFGAYSSQPTTSGRVHHNISYNDARGSASGSNQGAFRFWHGTNGLQLYNNVCYVTPGTLGQASCVSFDNGAGGGAETNMVIANNIFKTTSSTPIFYSSATPGSGYIVGNLYDSSGSSLIIANSSGGTPWANISTLAGWRAAGTNYEAANEINYGVVGDADFLNLGGFSPASTGVGFPIEQVTNFNLTGTSDAIGIGIYPWMVAVGPDGRDYHGSYFIATPPNVDAGASSYPQPTVTSGSGGPGAIIVQ